MGPGAPPRLTLSLSGPVCKQFLYTSSTDRVTVKQHI
jgi:hypothetical protein